jgi:hypothetical protein
VLESVCLARLFQVSLPATWAEWRAGQIDRLKAARIADAAERLIDPDRLAEFDANAARVAATKPHRSWRPGWPTRSPSWNRSRWSLAIGGRSPSGA